MKKLITICLLSVAIFNVNAQKTPNDKETIIKKINDYTQETIGNIKYDDQYDKSTIANSTFSITDEGVKIESSSSKVDEYQIFITYNFNPKDIISREIINMPDESPVGILALTFNEGSVLLTKSDKDSVIIKTYEKIAYIYYLKVDIECIDKIKLLFDELITIYKNEDKSSALKPLVDLMAKTKFWFSVNGSSETYTLDKVSINNCNLRISYYLEVINVNEDLKEFYITEVPLKKINALILEKSKSKPNCIMLESESKGFVTYILKDNFYAQTNSVLEIPLFINVTEDGVRDKVIELIKKPVLECDGKKLSLIIPKK